MSQSTTMITSPLHLYIIPPRRFDEKEYTTDIKAIILKLIKPKLQAKHPIIRLGFNSEDKALETIIDEIISLHPVATKVAYTPDFAKHKKKAYIKRNDKAIVRSTHILIIEDGDRHIGQEKILEQLDDSGLDRFLLRIDLNKYKGNP